MSVKSHKWILDIRFRLIRQFWHCNTKSLKVVQAILALERTFLTFPHGLFHFELVAAAFSSCGLRLISPAHSRISINFLDSSRNHKLLFILFRTKCCQRWTLSAFHPRRWTSKTLRTFSTMAHKTSMLSDGKIGKISSFPKSRRSSKNRSLNLNLQKLRGLTRRRHFCQEETLFISGPGAALTILPTVNTWQDS